MLWFDAFKIWYTICDRIWDTIWETIKKYETSNERSNLSLTIHFKYRRKYIDSVGFHLVWILVTGLYSIKIFQWTNWKFVVNVNVRKYEYFSWYPTAGQSHYSYKKIFSYHKMSPRSQSSIGSLSTRRRPLFRADIKTISKWHLHLGFAYINVRYLSEIEWPQGISSIILSYRYRSNIDCYSGQIPLRHRMVNVVSKMGLIDIASISGIISDRDSVAIPKWHNNLSIAD